MDFPSGELAAVSEELAIEALGDWVVARLMTLIPGTRTAGASAILMAHNLDQFTVI